MLLKAPRPWVASPLGFYVLRSMLKGDTPMVEKYTQVAQLVDNKKGCKVVNKLFISSSSQKKAYNLLNSSDIRVADFSKNENGFTDYVNNYEYMRYHEFSSKTEFILTNISLYESGWRSKTGPNPEMKIYNSFNYTQDVKYDGRLLEVPLDSNFKLVLLLPNDAVLLKSLFATLTTRGLAAAVNSLQPLFTAEPELSAPKFELRSRVEVKEKINALPNGSAVQYGSIAVCNEGTRVKVATCIYYPASPIIKMDEDKTHPSDVEPPPSYFAVVYDDTPLFTGDFSKGY